MVDKEAFAEKMDNRTSILKAFWKSESDKILVVRKAETLSIVGYACYLEMGGPKSCYLMRIAVRSKCQR